MTTELVSRRSVVVSWLLTSLCLRYGVARPSVWRCRKACKRRQFNGFGSDYPLNLSCFGFRHWSVLENWYVRTFLALRSEGCRSVRKVSQFWSQSLGNVAGSCNDLVSVVLIRKHCRSSSSRGRPLGTPFRSEHAGPFVSPPHPVGVAPRVWCPKLYRKSWVNLSTVARLTSAQVDHTGRTICWLSRLTRATRERTTIAPRRSESSNGERSDFHCGPGAFPVEEGGVLPQITSPRGQKGTHHA